MRSAQSRGVIYYGSAPWRAIPSHPEGKGKTGVPGASIKNTGDGARLLKNWLFEK
jgi:hypothetical protein